MARYPALPLYTDAYIADTVHLSNHEHGVYLRLLMFAWRRGDASIPDDDEQLRHVVNLTLPEWQSVKATVMAFWTHDSKRKSWHQKRLKKERKFLAKMSSKNRDAAVSRWSKTKKTPTKTMPPHPHPLLSSNEDSGVVPAKPSRQAKVRPPNGHTAPAKPVTAVMEAWNQMADRIGLALVKTLTEQRRRKAKAIVDKYGFDQFEAALQHIEGSDFCRGLGGRGWRADFDFVIRPESFVKLLEGRYDNNQFATPQTARSPPAASGSPPASDADDYSEEAMLRYAANYEAKQNARRK